MLSMATILRSQLNIPDQLQKEKIPFRLHWGKFVPDYDFEVWAKFYEKNLPKFKDFLKLREESDPNNIFLTDYWKLRLYGKM
jgi:D-arabinono-1,4-lactone oxidase